MREIFDFRIPEDDAARWLPSSVGERKSESTRRVVVSTDDPIFEEIGRIQRVFRQNGDRFFLGWLCQRVYLPKELDDAELFTLCPKRIFEPAGEECGTQYDDSQACPECGAGAQIIGQLILNRRRIPRTVDFAQTIAGEIVVSVRFVEICRERRLQGVTFEPVRLSNQKGLTSAEYFQIKVAEPMVEILPITQAGDGPFGEAHFGKCPRGDLIGLNLLSEVTVLRESVSDADILMTKQFVGCRRGLLRPRRLVLISQKMRHAIADAKLKGAVIEVAHAKGRPEGEKVEGEKVSGTVV